MAGEIDGIALGAVALGGAFIWSGIKGKSILQVIQNTVQGKSSASAASVNAIGLPAAPSGGDAAASPGGDGADAPSSGQLSWAQIVKVAHGAGFSGDGLVTISAIAQPESGRNPRSHNATPPDDSYGLWQINMLGSLGPARRMQYHLASNEALYDPATNARVAFALSGGGSNFSPWTTYTSGAYQGSVTAARTAARAAGYIGG